MKPLIKTLKPSEPFRKILYFIVKDARMKKLWLTIIFLNTIILAINHHRQEAKFKNALGNNN